MDRKRKASSSKKVEEAVDDLFSNGALDGAFSQSEDELETFPEDDYDVNGSETDDEDASDEEELSGDADSDNEEEEDNGPSYTIVKDANGGERYVYEEIDPVYDSDDTDAQGPANTIGDIPISYYDSYPHIGYDINGKKIMRPATREALDALLENIEVPKGWTGLTDMNTGNPLNLTQEELELVRKIQSSMIPTEDGDFDPYPATVEYFTSIEEKMPLSGAPEPKRRFLPSKHEAKRVMKLVRAIREGRILPYKPPEEREKEEEEETFFDIWQDEKPQEFNVMHIPAPKLPPPGYDASYNPPPEYLPTKSEAEQWKNTDPEEREKEYLPQKHDALRKVPAYDAFVKERFERCLDLYLAPRVRKNRLNIDPMSMLPKLPRPEELKPFPSTCQTVFRGHTGKVRSCAVSPDGCWLASGGDDGTVRVWDLLTGRQVWSVNLSSDEPVNAVRWRPASSILAAAVGEEVFLMIPHLVIDLRAEQENREILDAGFSYATAKTSSTLSGKEPPAKWERPGGDLESQGVLVRISVRSKKSIKVISWHKRGDYFCTVAPSGQRSSVAIHTLSKHLTQIPFRKVSGLAQAAHFHPSRPLFFIANQRTIRCYDLQKLELVKVLHPGAKWISSFDIHTGGDNIIVGSYDKRLLWHDLDLSDRPFKTMRFHEEAVRAVRYHKGGFPLFADASDDGSVQIFYGKVTNDLENPTIVPVKMLKGHTVVKSLGVVDLDWHPTEPWLVSAGADGTCRLWM